MLNLIRHARLSLVGLLLTTAQVFALPAEIEADRLVLAAEEKLASQDFDGARRYLERVDALKVTPEPTYYFLSGKVFFHYGELSQAREALSHYVEAVGRDDASYQDALRLMTKIEETQASQEAVALEREKLKQGGVSSALEITDTEGKAFDSKIQKLYLSDTLTGSLVLYINSVLKSYTYQEGKIKNMDTATREEYAIAVAEPAEIQLTKKQIDPQSVDPASISVSRLDAFGVNPFVTYRCSKVADFCEIKHPVDDTPWIKFAYNETAATDLSKALTRLLKALQR